MSHTSHALRYVVLQHSGVDEPHYDIMVETAANSLLATWRSPCWPIMDRTELTKLRDHRRTYLDYEGPIAGDRGAVYRVAEGICENVSNSQVRLSDIAISLQDGQWIAVKK